MTLKLLNRPSFGGFVTCVLFLWFYGSLTVLPIVDGQFETPNNICGGIFRFISGSINFSLNQEVWPDSQSGDSNKECLWTIIPTYSMWNQFKIVITQYAGFDTTDRIAFTTFEENKKTFRESARITGTGTKTMTGNILVITFISEKFNNTGKKWLQLNWDRTETAERVTTTRMIVPYYSYGKPSNQPNPYFAAGFTGNSLSTFGFTKGNNTEGYALEFRFWELQLLSQYCNATASLNLSCDTFIISKIKPEDATLEVVFADDKNATGTNLPTVKNKFGFFFLMWGGNFYNASGGGRMTLEYASVRE